GEPDSYSSVFISPNSTQAASVKVIGSGRDIWLIDLARGTSTRLTINAGLISGFPLIWSPDGNRIAFPSIQIDVIDLHVQLVSSSSSDPEILLKSNESKFPSSWSPDGHYLLYGNLHDAKTKNDIWVLPLDSRKPTRLLGTGFDESSAMFSPDGKWIS